MRVCASTGRMAQALGDDDMCCLLASAARCPGCRASPDSGVAAPSVSSVSR
jgi:hypothetical protein